MSRPLGGKSEMTENYAEEAKRRRLAFEETVEALATIAADHPKKDPAKVRIAAWNCGGFNAVKYEELMAVTQHMELDIIFVSETWASTESYPKDKRFARWDKFGKRMLDTGHYPYGCALWIADSFDQQRIRILTGIKGKSVWIKIDSFWFGLMHLNPEMTEDECKAAMKCPEQEAYFYLMGDLNMRFGELTEDTAWNARARAFEDWFPTHGLRLLDFAVPGTPTFHSKGRFGTSIVDVCLSNVIEEHRSQVHVVDNSDLGGSDHHLIFVDIPCLNYQRRFDRNAKVLNLTRLKQEGYADKYRAEVTRRSVEALGEFKLLENHMPATEEEQLAFIDHMDGVLQAIVNESALETLGERTRPCTGRLILHSEELAAAKRRRRKAHAKKKLSGLEEDRRAYNQATKEQARELQRTKEKTFREHTERAETLSATELAKMISAQQKRRTRGTGSQLACDADSLEVYRSYYAKQFSWQEMHKPVQPIQCAFQEGISPFTAFWIGKEMRKLPTAKAPGNTGLRNELLRIAPDEFCTLVEILFDFIWDCGVVPSSWHFAIIQPVPKKGDLTKIENNRPISLTENMRKLFERMILGELDKVIEPLDIAQGGFRRHRSTLEQCASLHELITRHWFEEKKRLVIAFLDIKAAYDTVHRTILWNKLVDRGINGNLFRVTRSLFEGNGSVVAVQGYRSARLEHQVGVLQGSILSPILYALFVNDLAARLRSVTSLKLHEQVANSFFYADDIALCARTIEEMRAALAICEEYSLEHCFRFAPNKCEVLKIAMPGIDSLTLYGQRLPLCTQFPYLGMIFDEKGINAEKHVRKLVEKTTDCLNRLRGIGYNGYGYSIAIKRRIYETFIRPKLEYGLCILPQTPFVKKCIAKAQSAAMCVLHSVGNTASHLAMEELAGVVPMELRQETLNVSWYSRVVTLGKSYMIYHARKDSEKSSNSNSAFVVGEHSRAMGLYRRETVWKGTKMRDVGWGERKAIIRKIRGESARLMSSERRAAKPDQVKLIDAARLKTAKLIDKVPSVQGRRLLTLWILKRLVGQPRPCRKCGHERASMRHIQECCNEPVDALVQNGLYADALVAMVRMSKECLGRPYKRCLKELSLCGFLVTTSIEEYQGMLESDEDPASPSSSDPEPAPD